MPVPLKVAHNLIQRGIAPMEIKGNIVETYKIGNSTVHIADGYFAKTKEEVEKVLDDLHEAGWQIVREIFENGGEI